MNSENKPYQLPADDYAARYRVDRATVFRWMKALAPLDDPRRMSFFVAGRKHAPPRFRSVQA